MRGSTATLLLFVSVLGCDRGVRTGASTTTSATTATPAPTVPYPADPLPTAAPSAAAAIATSPVKCLADAGFPGSFAIPEASGAAEVELTAGVREMLVISDSGHDGAVLLWKIPAGPPRFLKLPLDASASDDLEGVAWREHHLFTLTSSGAVRRFSPDKKGGLVRDGDAYALGPSPYACPSLTSGNCGKNYEGLCLRAPGTSDRCAGYAASKKEGALYCLIFRGEKLEIDALKPPIKLGLEKTALSDCAFGTAAGPGEKTLVVTTNIFGGSSSYVIDEATGARTLLDVPVLPTNEGIAIDKDGALYQFMDANNDVSLSSRMTCKGW
jgi:hypothetical protein